MYVCVVCVCGVREGGGESKSSLGCMYSVLCICGREGRMEGGGRAGIS